MAITKIHPIRRTLNHAIDYILDPNKVPDNMLISTFGCAKETAAEEFMLTKKNGNERCFTLAQHLIQSFTPGEVDEKTAHKIAVKLVNSFTDSQHEYVIATHTDKDHIHNHIIFNHTNFVTHKAFRMNMSAYKELRNLNDALCKEYGLSVIDNPMKKGMTKYEWMMKKKGLSYKKILQDNIDICINSSNSFEEFLSNMQKLGYEIKHGKHIAFKKNEQERFIRSKSLGDDYTEESIKERIALHPPIQIKSNFSYNHSIGLIRNMENYISFVENPVYRQKVALSNAKKLSATYNYLVKHQIDSIETLNNMLNQTKIEIKLLRESIRNLDDEIHNTSELLLHVNRINEYKDIYKKYSCSKIPNEFLTSHYSEILLYETSAEYIKKWHNKEFVISISNIEKKLTSLNTKKYETNKMLTLLKGEKKELETINRNLSLLFTEMDKTKICLPLIR